VSATSLLVLGVIRILQPVHGYDVRREIVSWRVDTLTTVKPGSIYAAIRTLEKDGSIAVHAREEGDRGAERTTYVLTGEGEKEFQTMLRQSWWKVTSPAEPLVPALTLMLFLPREELIAALHARIGWLEGELAAGAFMRASIKDGATGADGAIPEHVREIFDFVAARSRAELDWTHTLRKRLQAGAYTFTGERDFPRLGASIGVRAPFPIIKVD